MSAASDDNDDVQIVKVVPKKKAMTWVSSSFDDFGADPLPAQRSLSTPKGGGNVRATQDGRRVVSASQTSMKSFMSENSTRKRLREPVHRLSSQLQTTSRPSLKAAISSELWSEKYRPTSRAELAVHKKKVDEIADWLKNNSKNIAKHAAPILLLTGPPGAGKTACVQVLCREMGLDMQEWSSSSEQAADQWSNEDFHSGEKSKVDVYQSQSQSSVFHNFLLRANKYHALDILGSADSLSKVSAGSQRSSGSDSKGTQNLILVEDIPNIFLRDAAQFHGILRKYHYSGHCPLVFIVSESNNNSSNTLKLFPKDLQQQLNMCIISMNPVAPTMVIKLLNRVVTREATLGKFASPSSSVLETVAMSSSGDIRSALNTLQFACKQDTEDLRCLCTPNPKSHLKKQGSGARLKYGKSQKQHGEEGNVSALGVKDKTMFLFHAVGKILYFKRGDPKDYPDHPSLPSHLKDHHRDPLLLDPEDIAHQSHITGDHFTTFLHENYVDFLSSVEDLDRAAQYFSDSDHISTLWMAREELHKYSVSIATRGFIHSNTEFSRHDSSRKSQGWRPLHKSQWWNATKQASENITTARQLFQGYHWEPEVLCTEILPYIGLTNPTLHDTGQIRFVQDMTQFSHPKQVFRSRLERLDEKEVLEDYESKDYGSLGIAAESQPHHASFSGFESRPTASHDDEKDEDNMVPSSQTEVKTMDDEDDVVIEDFDDDF